MERRTGGRRRTSSNSDSPNVKHLRDWLLTEPLAFSFRHRGGRRGISVEPASFVYLKRKSVLLINDS